MSIVNVLEKVGDLVSVVFPKSPFMVVGCQTSYLHFENNNYVLNQAIQCVFTITIACS